MFYYLKNILYILSTILIISCNSSNKNESHNDWNRFSWVGQEIGGVEFEKMGIALPLKVDSSEYIFNAQLNIAQVNTIFHENVVTALYKSNPNLKIAFAIDTANNLKFIHNLKCSTGNYNRLGDVIIDDRFLYSDSSFYLAVNDTVLIGNIGANFFINQSLILDIKNQKFAIFDKLPVEFQSESHYIEMLFNNNMLIAPFFINGKPKNMIIDFSSSMFGFITGETFWTQLLDTVNKQIDYVSIDALGTKYKMYSGNSNADVLMGGTKIKQTNFTVHYPVRPEFEEYLKHYNVYGVVGLQFFDEQILVFDFKKMKMGVF